MSEIQAVANFPYFHKMEVVSYGGIDDPETGRNLTGSFHIINLTNTEGKTYKVAVDVGAHQGATDSNILNEQVEVIPDCVLITHAHMDHIGRLPVLWKDPEFKGKIYMSALTKLVGVEALLDSASIMLKRYTPLKDKHKETIKSLKDALKIVNADASSEKKKAAQSGRKKNGRDASGNNIKETNPPEPAMSLALARTVLAGYGIESQKDIAVWDAQNAPKEPIFSIKDVESMMKQVVTIEDGLFTPILPGVEVRPYNAGHVLGSKSYLFLVHKGPKTKVYSFFSGDLGSYRFSVKPAGEIKVPGSEFKLSFASVEGTYGNKLRPDFEAGMVEMESDIAHAATKKLASVYACFSLDRAQRVLHEILKLQKKNGWKFPIYLDSPLSTIYTDLYARYAEDDEFRLNMKNVRIIVDKDMRESLMVHENFRVIIAASGMAQGGAILSYLKTWLPNPRVEFSFPGYMAEGTVGWKLAVKGKGRVVLPEEGCETTELIDVIDRKNEVVVAARIYHYEHFSGHADQKDLIQWYRSLPKAKGMKLAIVHGVQDEGCDKLFRAIERKGMDVSGVVIPQLKQVVRVF